MVSTPLIPLVLFLCSIFLPICSCLSQDLEAGRRAANRGDFAEALINWAPLAEWGDAEAQYNMGLLLARGDGVNRDYHKAFTYFKKAADQGHLKAAGKLSTMYKFGDGVTKDLIQSEYWRRVSKGLEKVGEPTPLPAPETPPTVSIVITQALNNPTPVPTAAFFQATPTPVPDLAGSIPTQIAENAKRDTPSSQFNIDEWILPDDSGFSSSSTSVKSSSSSSAARRLNLVPDDEDY